MLMVFLDLVVIANTTKEEKNLEADSQRKENALMIFVL